MSVMAPDATSTVLAAFARRRRLALALPVLLLVYLAYIFFAFDVLGLASRARLDNARILVADSYSHKTHVSRANDTGLVTVSIEGERRGTYSEGDAPDWVTEADGATSIDLRDGNVVIYRADGVVAWDIPDWGLLEVRVEDGVVLTNLDGPPPDWISVSDARVGVTTDAGRLTVTKGKAETFRYEFGWPLFWFTLDSPYHGHGPLAILLGPRLDPDRSNVAGAWADFWGNSMWRHADVAWALGETLLMAFLGTMGAALVSLPLAFLAARNAMPLAGVRFAIRRIFDFVRGVDALIWTIALSRAFGPGPLTASLAILATDTGTLGKLFSEAIETIDPKQAEGVASTGASNPARWRWGVIPQIVPVLASQVLYLLESNVRSATIIGAITGGGIGLLLTQAMQTQKDWEDMTYYIILILVMVFALDSISGRLRRRIIHGAPS